MRVLVCGGRDYSDVTKVNDTLYALNDETPISLLIHGAAHGADHLAATWAKMASVDAWAFAADWSQHGRAAGPIRNQRMIDEAKPDLIVAFPGGRGTDDMVRRAMAAGIEVRTAG